MRATTKYLLIGFVGALIGNGIVFLVLAFGSSKYGTLADWVSGLGTVIAILFVYLQIDEQRKEFEEKQVAKVSIAISKQTTLKKSLDGNGKVLTDPEYYIWAVNDGLSSGSFMFLGFCREDEFKYIKDDDKNVIYNHHHDLYHDLQPYTNKDYQSLKPGQISKTEKIQEKILDQQLRNPDSFYVLYMSATGEIYKRKVKVTRNS